jgi:hypothetical protein
MGANGVAEPAVKGRTGRATPISPRGEASRLVVVGPTRSYMAASLPREAECQPIRRPGVPSSCIKGTISCCERTRPLDAAEETERHRPLPAAHARRAQAGATDLPGLHRALALPRVRARAPGVPGLWRGRKCVLSPQVAAPTLSSSTPACPLPASRCAGEGLQGAPQRHEWPYRDRSEPAHSARRPPPRTFPAT